MHSTAQTNNRRQSKCPISIGTISPAIVSALAVTLLPTAAMAQAAMAQTAMAQTTIAQTATAHTAVNEAPSSFFAILFSGGVTGFIIVMILIALSIYSAYLIVEQILRGARQACQDNPSLLSFVLMHGIAELEFGWNAVEKTLEDSLAEQAARMFRKIEYLSVIGNIAPMIGLLGTVIGMILAFQNVASTQGTASAPQLAEGIYQALVTTVGGLIVAIPSIGAFAIFRNRIDQFIAEAAHISQHVFTPLRRRAKKGSASS